MGLLRSVTLAAFLAVFSQVTVSSGISIYGATYLHLKDHRRYQYPFDEKLTDEQQ